MDFWLGELTRRRTQRVLDDIASATVANAGEVAKMVRLIEEGAAQNAQMVALNRSMHRIAKVNAVLAALAVVAAVVAIFA